MYGDDTHLVLFIFKVFFRHWPIKRHSSCPVSGRPLERESRSQWVAPSLLGHQGVGDWARIPALSATVSHLGAAFAFPWSSLLCHGHEGCTGPMTFKPLHFFHSVHGATHWMSSVLRCIFFFTFEHLWNPYASYNWWRIILQWEVFSFLLVHKIIVWHTIVIVCRPLLKYDIATLSRTYSFVVYFFLIF